MGTTVQSIAGRGNQTESHGPSAAAQPVFQERGAQWNQRPQHSIESPEATFSTPVQNGASLFVQAAAQNAANFENAAAQQRGRLAQGNAGAGDAPHARNALTPTPSGQTVNGNAANQANMERRGPVEFNHAISYVNKIKVCWVPFEFTSCKVTQLTPDSNRTVSRTNLKSTSNSWKFFRHTNESRNLSKTSTPKSLPFSILPLICWRTLSSSCQNLLVKQKLPQAVWRRARQQAPVTLLSPGHEMDRRCLHSEALHPLRVRARIPRNVHAPTSRRPLPPGLCSLKQWPLTDCHQSL